jgi:hypothetical protein
MLDGETLGSRDPDEIVGVDVGGRGPRPALRLSHNDWASLLVYTRLRRPQRPHPSLRA